MIRVRALLAVAMPALPSMVAAQQMSNASLEKTLWDVDQQWLCDGPYQKPYQGCVFVV